MAIVTEAPFTSGNAGAAPSALTASKTWLAGRVYLIGVITHKSAGPPTTPTVFGTTDAVAATAVPSANVTWATSSVARSTTFVYSPATDITQTLTIDYGGVTQTHVQWIVDESPNADTGSNGLSALGTAITGSGAGTTASAGTLAAFTDAASGAAWFFAAANGAAMTAKSGFTALSLQASFFEVRSEYRQTDADRAPSYGLAGSASWVGTAIEIKKSPVIPGPATHLNISAVPTLLYSAELLSVSPTVQILDAGGLQTADTSPVIMTMTVTTGTGIIAATSTTTVNAAAGLATFSNVIPRCGYRYGLPAMVTFTFSCPALSLTAVTTASIPVYVRSPQLVATVT